MSQVLCMTPIHGNSITKNSWHIDGQRPLLKPWDTLEQIQHILHYTTLLFNSTHLASATEVKLALPFQHNVERTSLNLKYLIHTRWKITLPSTVIVKIKLDNMKKTIAQFLVFNKLYFSLHILPFWQSKEYSPFFTCGNMVLSQF